MRQLILAGAIDAFDDLIESETAKQSLENVAGILARRKTYLLKDNNGEFSPVASRGFLFRNAFKALEVDETNDLGVTEYKAQIRDASLLKKIGFKTKLTVVDPVQILLKWRTDENDSTTFAGYEVAPAGAVIGDFEVPVVYAGPVNPEDLDVPVPSRITFSDDLVPSYEAVKVTSAGSPLRTSVIRLNVPLVEDLSAGTPVRVSVPVIATGPKLLINIFTALGVADRMDSSFFVQDDQDEALGVKLWVHVRREDKISAAKHIGTILELCDLFITANDNGTLSLIRGLEFKGFQPEDTISDREILDGYAIIRDDSKLIRGYQVLFRSGSTVQIQSAQAPDEITQEFKNLDDWKPQATKGNNIMEYKHLYADSSSASFFGDRVLLYRQYPRWTLEGIMKRFFHNQPSRLIKPQMFKTYALTVATTFIGDGFVNEPVFVKFFSEDDKAKTIKIKLQLNNFISPNLPLDRTVPSDITGQAA